MAEHADAAWCPPEPRELPALREHLAEYLTTFAAHLFTSALIREGRGTLRPVGDPDIGAELMLADEYRRLHQARLFYVTSDITPLVHHAARNLRDRWDIEPQDLPALTGFMLFAEPLATYAREDGKEVAIVAVSWGETTLISHPDGGLWLTFWSATDFAAVIAKFRAVGFPSAEATRLAHTQNAELTWDNEIYMPWGATQAVVPDEPGGRSLDPTKVAAAKTTIDWLRVVHAGWIFCQPNGFTEVTDEHLPKTLRKRSARAGHSTDPVRVLSVSRKTPPRPARAFEPTGRTVGVRFPVAPFLRRQAYGPNHSLRRWKVVSGHWRGPADAPVRIGKKVNLVDTPPSGQQGRKS
ncbi:hypothetical protein NQK81_34825 [Amycolatopsis roodepoortensis]|uniref:hypothetical protein n=1 Tax=Amycolatopsis roodepoortensis TaxID=700274 RepID=UPI00214AC56E|nr:hypothetical protein [Amycolatopsis roodepoortensis]UUV29898.1 hypothetical protein NQK81_34825 [Amycolatopsis roodepoortensis]